MPDVLDFSQHGEAVETPDWSQHGDPVDTTPATPMPEQPDGWWTKGKYGVIQGAAEAMQGVGQTAERLQDPGALKPNFRNFQQSMIRAGEVGDEPEQEFGKMVQEREAQRQQATATGRALQTGAEQIATGAGAISDEAKGPEIIGTLAKNFGGFIPLLAASAVGGPELGAAVGAAVGGAQTGGEAWKQAYETYKAQGMPDEEAKAKADADATKAGLSSMEAFAALPGAGKALVERQFAKQIGSATLSPVVKAAIRSAAAGADGSLVMGATRLMQDAMAKQSYRKDLTLAQAVQEVARDMVGGALAGGAIHAVTEIPGLLARRPPIPPPVEQQAAQAGLPQTAQALSEIPQPQKVIASEESQALPSPNASREPNEFQAGKQAQPSGSGSASSVEEQPELQTSIAWLQAVAGNNQEAIRNATSELLGRRSQGEAPPQVLPSSADSGRVPISTQTGNGGALGAEIVESGARSPQKRGRIGQSAGEFGSNVGGDARSPSPSTTSGPLVEALRQLQDVQRPDQKASGARTLLKMLSEARTPTLKAEIIGKIKDAAYALHNSPPATLHANVPTFARQSQRPVPVQESGQGVQPSGQAAQSEVALAKPLQDIVSATPESFNTLLKASGKAPTNWAYALAPLVKPGDLPALEAAQAKLAEEMKAIVRSGAFPADQGMRKQVVTELIRMRKAMDAAKAKGAKTDAELAAISREFGVGAGVGGSGGDADYAKSLKEALASEGAASEPATPKTEAAAPQSEPAKPNRRVQKVETSVEQPASPLAVLEGQGVKIKAKGALEGAKDGYGDAYAELVKKRKGAQSLFSEDGQTLDQAVQVLHDQGFKDVTRDNLLETLSANHDEQVARRQGTTPEAVADKFHAAIDEKEGAKPGKTVIGVVPTKDGHTLNPGDSFKVNGETFTVKAGGPEDFEKTIHLQGDKSGAQELDWNHGLIAIDADSLNRAEKPATKPEVKPRPVSDAAQKWIDRLEALKRNKGQPNAPLLSPDLGNLSEIAWDGLLNAAQDAIKKGKPIWEAADAAIDWLRKNHADLNFNEAALRSQLNPDNEGPSAQPAAVQQPSQVPPIIEKPPVLPTSAQGEPAASSIQNAHTDAQRVRLGLAKATQMAAAAWPHVQQQAEERMLKDKDAVKKLVNSLIDRPRPITDVENFMLLHDMVDKENQHVLAMENAVKAMDAGDAEGAVVARQHEAALLNDLQDLYNVTKAVGTLNARALNARKAWVNSQYKLVNMLLEKRAVNDGRPLSADEVERIKGIADAIKKASDALDRHVAEATETARDTALSDAVAEHLKTAEAVPRIAPHILKVAEQIVGKIKRQGDEAYSRLMTRTWSVGPEVIQDLAIYGSAKIAVAGYDFAKWSASMIAELGERVRPHLPEVWIKSQEVHEAQLAEAGEGKKAVRARIKKTADLSEQRKATTEAIAAKIAAGQRTKVSPLVDKLTRQFIEGGIRDKNKLVEAVHGVLSSLDPTWTENDTKDAISHYGDFRMPKQDEVSKAYRELRSIILMGQQRADIEAGKAPKATGYVRGKPTDAQRREQQLVNDAKRRFGVVPVDEAAHLQSALDARKTWLRNRMADLKHEIANKARTIKERSPSPTDAEVEALKAEYEAVKKEHEAMFPVEQKPLTDAQKLKAAMASVERSIAENERRIREKDLSAKAKTPGVTSPELEARKAHNEALKAQLDELRSLDPALQANAEAERLEAQRLAAAKQVAELERRIAENDLAPKGQQASRPARDEALELFKQRADELRAQIAAIRAKPADVKYAEQLQSQLAALEKQITERQQKLASGDLGGKPSAVNRPLHPLLEQARQRLDAVNAQIEAARKAARAANALTPDQRALKAYKARMQTQLAEYATKLANRDFSVRKRQPMVLDKKALALKADVENIRNQWRIETNKDRLRNREWWDKAMKNAARWRRFNVLSSPSVILKLMAATGWKMASIPLETAAGIAAKQIPGVRQVMQKAGYEGHGSTAAEVAAWKGLVTDGMRDAFDTLYHGASRLDDAHGYHDGMPKTWLEFNGRIHAAFKAPLKRAMFERALQLRGEHAMREGLDVSDPVTQSALQARAYLDAQKELFQNQNVFAAKAGRFLKSLEEPSKITGRKSLVGTAIARTVEGVVPIRTIPLNMMGEALTYGFGTIPGLGRVALALNRGLEKLSPEEADMIMRQLKKGLVGNALAMAGVFGAWSIAGGFHEYGKKDKKGAIPRGGFRVNGVDIPANLTHHPAMEIPQVFATARQVANEPVSANDAHKKGYLSGAYAAAMGLVEDTPFIQEMLASGEWRNPKSAERMAKSAAAGYLIPAGVSWLAKKTDLDKQGNEIKRKPTTFGQELEFRIPGLRKNVPEAR